MSATTSQLVKSAKLYDRTTAEVTFENGHTMTIKSEWDNAQNNGNSYSGADWTTFGNFSNRVRSEIEDAQSRWGLPTAEVRFIHDRKTVEIIERSTVVTEIHSLHTIPAKETARD